MGRLGGCSFMLEFGWGDREGGYHIFSVFMMLLIFLSWLVHDSLFCLSYLLPLSLLSLIRCY